MFHIHKWAKWEIPSERGIRLVEVYAHSLDKFPTRKEMKVVQFRRCLKCGITQFNSKTIEV